MLRQLVTSSLQDYLDFFKQHAAIHPLDPQQDVVMWSCPPVFDTELVVRDGEPSTSTYAIESIYLSPIAAWSITNQYQGSSQAISQAPL